MPFPQITPLGTPPSRNNPATFRPLMDARMAEQNVLVTEINAFGTALNNYTASGVPFATNIGGTANALTISLPERDAALTNMFFFTAGNSNTSTTVTINLNGEGAKPVETPLGTNPPVGYIGYAGSVTYPFLAIRRPGGWIVRRQDEYVPNIGNGEAWKFSNGLLICRREVLLTSLAITTAAFGGFRSDDQSWTYPHAFVALPSVHADVLSRTAFGASIGTTNTTGTNYAFMAVASQASAAGRSVSLTAIGRWY